MTTRIAPGVGANLLGQHAAERNQDATAYVGNLDPQVLHSPLHYLFLLSRVFFFIIPFPLLFQISEELLWELFVQAGPVGMSLSQSLIVIFLAFNNLILLSFLSVNVYVPKDRVTNQHQGYGFVEFRSEEDADYVTISNSLLQI